MKLILRLLRHKPRALAPLENSTIKARNSLTGFTPLEVPRRGAPLLTGFTLIELIMTIVVVGIVAIPISITLSKHIQSVFDSQDLTMANNLARFDLERMNNITYASIVSDIIPNYQDYAYNLTRTVSLVNPLVGTESTKKVTVQVTKPGSATLLSKIVTYISNNVRYPFP